MASKAVKRLNESYKSRHGRKSSKGAGVYALQPAGAGPNGTHVTSRDPNFVCRCGGCSGRGA